VGPDYPIIIKINGSDWLPLRDGLGTPELVEVARIMEREGVDAIEVSVGTYESGFPVVRGTFGRCLRGMANGSVRFLPGLWRVFFSLSWPLLAIVCNLIWRRSEGYNLRYARQFKAALSIPVICVGGFLTRERIAKAIEDEDCDAVSSGRAFIADPFFYRHLKDGATGPQCVFCNACVGQIGTQALDCFHPRVRAEKDAMLAEELPGSAQI
jgi:2,4-dienoyl-CoA reductase-like NADH-dependent reductase (Old Yellow Enzyme family)